MVFFYVFCKNDYNLLGEKINDKVYILKNDSKECCYFFIMNIYFVF